jgi:hypothetical protein
LAEVSTGDEFSDEVPIADAIEQQIPVSDSADADAPDGGRPGGELDLPLESDEGDWRDQQIIIDDSDQEDLR